MELLLREMEIMILVISIQSCASKDYRKRIEKTQSSCYHLDFPICWDPEIETQQEKQFRLPTFFTQKPLELSLWDLYSFPSSSYSKSNSLKSNRRRKPGRHSSRVILFPLQSKDWISSPNFSLFTLRSSTYFLNVCIKFDVQEHKEEETENQVEQLSDRHRHFGFINPHLSSFLLWRRSSCCPGCSLYFLYFFHQFTLKTIRKHSIPFIQSRRGRSKAAGERKGKGKGGSQSW